LDSRSVLETPSPAPTVARGDLRSTGSLAFVVFGDQSSASGYRLASAIAAMVSAILSIAAKFIDSLAWGALLDDQFRVQAEIAAQWAGHGRGGL
jgi:hypothetical protein